MAAKMKLVPYETRPLYSIFTVFAAWKGFLLSIALGTSISDDYDTSTSLFFEHVYGAGVNASALATKLTRWDSLYFMQAAHGGYIYEQQWAFGAALPVTVQGISWSLKSLHLAGDGALEPLVAISFNNLTHLVAVLALYRLTLILFNNKTLAYVAAVLHILSPAGLFLSAPCAESPFACLSFIGNLLFAMGLKPGASTWKRMLAFLGAGVSFGLSTSFRSNGLISGLLFAVEAVKCLFAFFRHPSFPRLALLASLIIGGLSIAAGSVVPQTVAWFRYCKVDLIDAEPRPWCSRLVPSIFTFVQEHYW
jgi:phosphatidylinositol glycan class V